MAGYIGEAKRPTLEIVRKGFVVKTQAVQDSGLDVVWGYFTAEALYPISSVSP